MNVILPITGMTDNDMARLAAKGLEVIRIGSLLRSVTYRLKMVYMLGLF